MSIRPIAFLGALALAAGLAGAVQAEKVKCVVSGQEVELTDKTPSARIQGKKVYFCCQNCPKAFAKTPEKFVKTTVACPLMKTDVAAPKAAERVVINNGLWYVCCAGCVDGLGGNPAVLKELDDVVSGKTFKVKENSPRAEFKGQIYLFESPETKAAFEKDPEKYAVVYGK